jgi:N-acetylglucosamine-6-phosphate deacetylase
MIALTAAVLFTPTEQIDRPIVLIDEGTIAEVTTSDARAIPSGCRTIDFPGAVLVPGFLDIHIHGGAGFDVMDSDSSALPAIEELIAEHGVTAYLPTTVTAPIEKMLAALERLADAIERAAGTSVRPNRGRARPLGIHLEGPFISRAKRGVHPPEDILPPSAQAFEKFWQASRGHIRMMTIAPELPGAADVIEQAARCGVCVSLGHSDSDSRSAQHAIERGARHATHTFNAMRVLDHREPGILGVVLSNDRITADIIADGIHLAPEIVELFLKAKGTERAVLITDAISATGMPDGKYRLGSFDVEVSAGRCMANGKLAGSVLTMDRAIRNVMQITGCSLQQAARLATVNPAAVIEHRDKGILAAGTATDIVVLTPEGQVVTTLVGGVGE